MATPHAAVKAESVSAARAAATDLLSTRITLPLGSPKPRMC